MFLFSDRVETSGCEALKERQSVNIYLQGALEQGNKLLIAQLRLFNGQRYRTGFTVCVTILPCNFRPLL